MAESIPHPGVMTFLRTVRHLKATQIRCRLESVLRRQLWSVWPRRLQRKLDRVGGLLLPLLWESPVLAGFAEWRAQLADLRSSQADSALQGQLRLCNTLRPFPEGIEWNGEDVTGENRLAGFELHYQGYLEDLALAYGRTGRQEYAREWQEIVWSWIDANPPRSADFLRLGWSPYVISERLRNWLSSLHWLRTELTEDLCRALEESLSQQLAFLMSWPEHDLQANHLLQNLCGASVGLALFGGQQVARRQRALLNTLAQVASAQVLADGMHEERTYSYHVKALCDILDVIRVWQLRGDVLDAAEHRAVCCLQDVTCRMVAHMQSTYDVLGELPLLNDGPQVQASMVRWLVREFSPGGARGPTGAERCSGSGYLVGKCGAWAAVMDVGPAGPDHQMGHAHADHLTFELWRHGHKIVSDSGNASYASGKKRLWYRGTEAHSTVRIDGEDSLELWSAFRVGRRPRRHAAEVLEDGPRFVWYGEHDGYAHLPGRPVHRRWFQMDERMVLIRDLVDGRAEHQVESSLHFHPQVQLESADWDPFPQFGHALEQSPYGEPGFGSDSCWSTWRWSKALEGGERLCGYAVALAPPECKIWVTRRPGWHAYSFSVEQATTSLVHTVPCCLPVKLAWLLVDAAAVLQL